MLATFNSTWDWTAIGTLTLAAVTLALAAATFWMVQLTRRALAQSRDEIGLSRREVEEAHRPVVIPTIATAARSVPMSAAERRAAPVEQPSIIRPGVLAVPVQNIGAGPALHVVASVTRMTDEGEIWAGPIEPQMPGVVAGLGKDATTAIAIRVHGWESRWNFELTLEYGDVAGKRWTTTARYVTANARYETVNISEVSKL